MRKSAILLAALSLVLPAIAGQSQAAPRHRAHHVVRVLSRERAAPAVNPLCNNIYQKQNIGWLEYYHCFHS